MFTYYMKLHLLFIQIVSYLIILSVAFKSNLFLVQEFLEILLELSNVSKCHIFQVLSKFHSSLSSDFLMLLRETREKF